MRTLLLLRHAKSSWDEPHLADHERPLNKRGRRAAPRMGTLLADLDLVPEAIVSSTATRARSTAELVAEASGYDGAIELRDDLYHASAGTYLGVLRDLDPPAERVMLVGHNPGIENLVETLAGHYERMPTAALACFEVDVLAWSAVDTMSQAALAGVWRPKEIS